MDDTARRAQAARETCPFLTAKQAAFHLGLPLTALQEMRARGTGPLCRLHGRTWRYHTHDNAAWSNARAKAGGPGRAPHPPHARRGRPPAARAGCPEPRPAARTTTDTD